MNRLLQILLFERCDGYTRIGFLVLYSSSMTWKSLSYAKNPGNANKLVFFAALGFSQFPVILLVFWEKNHPNLPSTGNC